MISPSTHLADIVIEQPATADVFERHALDYCCGGRRPLADACAESGLDVDAIVAELEQAAADVDETTGGAIAAVTDDVAGLIGHIVATHHTYLRRELPRLRELMSKVVAAHGERHPELGEVADVLVTLTDDLLPHLEKEEQVLFPLAIRLLGAVEPPAFHCGSVTNPIHVMFLEHDRAGELLAKLRALTDGYVPPPDACPTWHALDAGLAALEADVHRHVHLENNVLFPRIVDLESRLA